MKPLYTKYRPKRFEEMTEQKEVIDILKNQLSTDTVRNCYLFVGSSGIGKAQPLDSIIQTPRGPVTMRDINVGDELFGQDGKIYNILGKYPQGIRDIYRLRFSDGSEVRCDKGHIWNAFCCHSHNTEKYENVTANRLYELVNIEGVSPTIRPNKAVEYREKELPIHPYVLGAFLGNGGYTSIPVIYDYYGDVYEECCKFIGDKYTLNYSNNRSCNRFSIRSIDCKKGRSSHRNIFAEKLKEIGIYGLKSREKYIPEIYLHSSIEQRKLLLAGLMDTDGYKQSSSYERRSSCRYCTTSKRLALGVLELARSLGITAKMKEYLRSWGRIEYYIVMLPREFCPFIVKRKSDGWRPVKQFYKRKLISIEECGQEECCCIMTSNPEGLYLTDDFIVTHNTTVARILAREINKGSGGVVELDAASHNSVDDVRNIINKSNYQALDADYRIFIIDECFVAGSKISTENGELPIEKVTPGMKILTLEGESEVDSVHKSIIPNNRICCVKLSNGKNIITTKDHLFMTTFGWIPAKDLLSGDELINEKGLCNLWGEIRDREYKEEDMFDKLCKKVVTQSEGSEIKENIYKDMSELLCRIYNDEKKARVLFNRMLKAWGLEEEKNNASAKDLYTFMCNLWKFLGRSPQGCEKDLFERVLFSTAVAESENILCLRTRGGTQETFIRKIKKNIGIWNTDEGTDCKIFGENENNESHAQSSDCSEDAECERIEWESACLEGKTRGKWTIYSGTINAVQKIGKFLGIGVSDIWLGENSGVSYELQSRPLLSREETCDRSGWQWAQVEKPAVERYKERDDVERIWVESVAFYEQGDTGEFGCCGSEYTEMYDLTVRNSPTYFVDGVLVHNCHSLSTQAWQSMLKTLEEPNSKTVYMFCTTDPQKIPSTIINRVQRFDLKRISYSGIVSRLGDIVKNENSEGRSIRVDNGVLEYIAKLSNGGMRDAISMLDKCLSYSEDLTLQDVVKILGSVNYDKMFELFFAMYNCDEKEVIRIVEEIYNAGADLSAFIKQFTNFTAEICKYKLFNNFDYLRIPELYKEELNRANNCDSEILKQILNGVNDISSKIRYESQPLPVVETELLLLSKE